MAAEAGGAQAHPLPADCGIAQAEILRGQLLALCDVPDALHLDGSAVNRVSTAVVQLLLALSRTRAADGKTTSLLAPSEALAEAIGRLGLTADLPFSDLLDSQDETNS